MTALPALPLATLAHDARALDAAAFRARHGDAFLIKSGADKVKQGQLKTVAVVAVAGGHFVLGESVVYPLLTAAPPVTLGRAKSSDVVIADASVSTFHAGLLRDGDRWTVQDADSRNGTAFDGAAVPARGRGDPVVLVAGKLLRVGSVELLFADAALVAQLAAIESPA